MCEILLINVHSLENAGDVALTHVSLQQIEKYFPECNVKLVLDFPENDSSDYQIIRSLNSWIKPMDSDGMSRWNITNLLLFIPTTVFPLLLFRCFNRKYLKFTPRKIRRLIQSYLDADIIISKPGGFLYSSGRGLVLIINLYSLIMALVARKPLYLFPQSYGPFFRMWEKLIIRWIFSKAKIIMAREPVSYDLLNSLNIPSSKSFLLPDLAFSYVGKPREFAENWLTEKGINVHTNEPLLGFTVINWGEENKRFQRQEKYENAVVMVARQFIEQYNGRVFFFTQVTGPSYSQDDRIPTRRILARLEDLSKEVFFIEQPLPPDNLKSLYGSMDIFIGTRMHSNIFALSEGVPVIAIGYQYKTMGIMKMLELESWVLDINDLEVEKLLILFQSLWRARDNVREKILRIVPSLKNDANNAGKIIYHDYYQ